MGANGQGSIRVYLCDEVTELRTLLRVAIEDNGTDVVGESGDARTMLGELSALDPDVVVLDLSAMPRTHGA